MNLKSGKHIIVVFPLMCHLSVAILQGVDGLGGGGGGGAAC